MSLAERKKGTSGECLEQPRRKVNKSKQTEQQEERQKELLFQL